MAIETPIHWARHLLGLVLYKLRLVVLQICSVTFYCRPDVLKGLSRKGPTFLGCIDARCRCLVLHGQIHNIQTSWVKMGEQGVAACLNSGANDLGGTLMNETITRSAGAQHGQEMPPSQMDAMIRRLARVPSQRKTCYSERRKRRSIVLFAAELTETINDPPGKIKSQGS